MTQSSIRSMAPAFDRDLFTDDVLADPYATYAMLRELGPVVWLAAHDTFVVTRYREARTVLASPDLFCSGQGVALNDPCDQQTAGRSLIATDGDLHSHLRKILAHNITPRAIRHLETQIQTQADALISDLVARGSFDAVEDLARSLPLSIVPDLVGWPADGRDHLLRWAGATFNFLGPMNDRAFNAVPDVVAMLAFAAEMAAAAVSCRAASGPASSTRPPTASWRPIGWRRSSSGTSPPRSTPPSARWVAPCGWPPPTRSSGMYSAVSPS